MASTDAMPVPRKNTAYRITFPIFDADGDLVTGATGLDSEVSKDGGTFTDCTNEATEIATSSGMYYLDLTSTEMNADTVAVIVKTSSSGAKTTPIVMYPQEAGDIQVNVTYWNGTAVATPDTAGYPKVTIKSGTGAGELSLSSGAVIIQSGTGTGQISLSSGAVIVQSGTGTGQISLSGGAVTVGTNNDKTGYALSASGVDAIWDEPLAAHTTADTPGQVVNMLTQDSVTLSSDVALGSIVGQLLDGGTSWSYDRTTDSLEAIRDRGDAAWTTGGGGSITDILNVVPLIPLAIDLANTASWRIGLMLTNALDDLPSTAEITPGTISIDRKAIGGTSWSAILTDQACSEDAGIVYFDEVFDAGTGYAEGDSIRITFKSQKITVSANDYEVIDATGRIFYTSIRSSVASAAGIADAVWDEARSGHTAGGSFGEGVASVQGNVTGNVAGSVGSIATNGISAASLAADAVAEIADAVWDEDIVAAHSTADTGGLILSQLTKRSVTFNTAVADGSVIGQIADDGTATYDRTTDSLQAIAVNISGSALSISAIADAVWEESLSEHSGAGSTGKALADVPDNVWDEVMESGAPSIARTARHWMRLFASALFGKTASTGDWSAKSIDDSKTRISATLTATGQRSEIDTLDGS
jgi:hypothetical protein